MKRLFRGLPTALALAAAAWLAGCANAVIVGQADTAPGYSLTELAAAGSGENELRVIVDGDPFGAGAAATGTATVAAMQGNVIGTPVKFALDPVRERRPPTRVMVYFNPRNMVGGESICAPNGAVSGAAGAGGELRVIAAWCQTDFKISSVSGRTNGVTGLNSPKFRALLAGVTQSLFPQRDELRMRRGDGCQPPC